MEVLLPLSGLVAEQLEDIEVAEPLRLQGLLFSAEFTQSQEAFQLRCGEQ